MKLHIGPLLIWLATALVAGDAVAGPASDARPGFVRIQDQQFTLGGKPYCYVGANVWFGAYLGADEEFGDRLRLQRELDLLASSGLSNLRVLGASEKSPLKDSLTITFRDRSNAYNEALLRGLDYLLAEMAKRGMKAVIYLNNFWEWSGGMGTYLYWTNGGEFIDLNDPQHPWPAFADFSAGFYVNEQAMAMFRDYIRAVVGRTNTVTGRPYRDDPSIMAWQLANEPRPGYRNQLGFSRLPQYNAWVDQTAALIKSLDPNHLVSTGSEGTMGCLQDEQCYLDAHGSEHIDYLTFHMWPKNWGWFNARNPGNTFAQTLEKSADYISRHLALAERLGKPVVLEEFGLERDGGGFSTGLSTSLRDRFYQTVFERVEQDLETRGLFRGTNFWTWGGYGRAQHEDYRWQPGDRSYTGDPPQEQQGLNSVFDTDASTLDIIRRHAHNLAAADCGPALYQIADEP
jgi:mannan endo-1,4-beta-mannosidase